MKIKIIQADTRNLKIFTESRMLAYGPTNQMNLELIAALNDNILTQPNDPNSIACCLNLLKCKLLNQEYEFIKGNEDDWESGTKKAHCWIKIHSLIDQLKNPQNKEIDLFCFIDSDAWIRDEDLFMSFCHDFLTSSYDMALPRDIELPGNSYFNSGFIAVKNNNDGLEILETIYNHPDYREFDKKSWHEQTELSLYHEKNPGRILVLPLTDFNTPCGTIIRHCWIKHLIEPLIIQEVLAFMTKLAVQSIKDPQYKLGSDILISLPS